MSKITESAQNKDCTLRIPNFCNFNPETVVACHVTRRGHGKMGGKPNDIHSVRGCDSCHAVIDSRVQHPYTELEIINFKYDALIETQEQLIEEYLITLS